ncbi:MAG: rubrerythrin family protein [Aquificae bacterium]|nr:rubrerythrin family protein [Aquificota bacterium]
MNQRFIKDAIEFYKNEITDYYLYISLAQIEKDENLKKDLLKIANMEKKHAQFWKTFIEKRGVTVPSVKPDKKKIIFVKLLRKIFNPMLVISFLEMGESAGFQRYYKFLKEQSINLDEYEQKALKNIILDEIAHETTFKEKGHYISGLSNIRDFVLGMNDGLVEILGAVAGLSAVYIYQPEIVAVSGLIVGMAGALSMGIGAYISVRSQRQVNESLKEKMEILFEVSPKSALQELKKKLEEAGLTEEIINDVVEKIGKNKQAVKKLLIQETQENEILSGIFTGVAYLFGVFFPVVPFFFAPTSYIALPFSILFAGLALSIVATIISILSGISIKKKIMEMVLSAFGAAGIAYIFGKIMQYIFGINIEV